MLALNDWQRSKGLAFQAGCFRQDVFDMIHLLFFQIGEPEM